MLSWSAPVAAEKSTDFWAEVETVTATVFVIYPEIATDRFALVSAAMYAALLSIRRKSRDDKGKVVDVLDGLYNVNRYQYAMELSLD